MKIVIKTILQQIITQCARKQDIIKKLASCDPCGRKSGLKTVAFLLRLSIIIQKLDILAEFNEINGGQLYTLRGKNKLYFRKKKCILSLTIDFFLANSVDYDQMPHLGLHCLPKYGFRSQ